MSQLLLYILRNKKRGSIAYMRIKFGEKDVNAGKVKVTKVNILIRNNPQPRA